MPTRTINLKLVTGKRDETKVLRQALWTTHKEVNKAVEQIERLLLACRQRHYWTTQADSTLVNVMEGDVAAEALRIGRAAQLRNDRAGTGSDETVLVALRQLYEKLIPSCLLDETGGPLKGDAQSSNAWVSPLMDPTSEGGLSVYDKVLDPMPAWIVKKDADDPAWFDESIAWLHSDVARRLKSAAGSPPAWLRKLRQGLPWQDAFIEDQEKKRKELESGSAPVVKKLKELGLLPLLKPHFKNRLDPGGNGVSVWDRMAVRLAVAHLLSWESWNHNTKREHTAVTNAYETLMREHVQLETEFEKLRKYETARQQTLKQVAFADDERPYTLGSRGIRAWGEIREQWREKGNSKETRIEILNSLQTKLRGKFGDPDFFHWLAGDDNVNLWKDIDAVVPFVKCNNAKRQIEKRQEFSLMTFADARMHPRWIMYEAPGGSNLRNYSMNAINGRLELRIPLLSTADDGGLVEQPYTCRLAPSGQLSELRLETSGKKMRLCYRSAHQDFEGLAGGADILFDRSYFEHYDRSDNILEDGRIGSVWFKLTLDVQTKAPAEWLDGKGRVLTPPEVHHFNTALSNKSKHTDKLRPGLRVLSVDLGLRSFAACSVFELVEGQPKGGLAFPTADGRKEDDPTKLWAKHERSFRLTLPGEETTTGVEASRRQVMDEIYSLRRDIRLLKRILQLGVIEENDARDEAITELLTSVEAEGNGSSVGVGDLAILHDARFRSTPELWRQRCLEVHKQAERLVSARFSAWRKRGRPKSNSWEDWHDRRSYGGGKSIWAIEYFEAVRKLIMNWNLRGRVYGEVNRQDKKMYGSIAARLLAHINNMKEDRTKSGADMLVQAARGYIPNVDGFGWRGRYKPCRLILFEDLGRYRFRIDRPRRENSQLMKWTHREILAETTMQAELYGIITATTAAGFSSRYLASSGAPGWRCRVLKETDFEEEQPKPFVAAELDWMLGFARKKYGGGAEALRWSVSRGTLVPWSGGEMFVTVNRDGGAHIVHADINAAQNLQRRFWSRCGEAYRITCQSVDGERVYQLETQPGARLLGALQQLENGETAFQLVDSEDTKLYRMQPYGKKKLTASSTPSEDALLDDTDDASDEAPDESDGTRVTFFRDPSGVVFEPDAWVPSLKYWSTVREKIWEAMQRTNSNVSGAGDAFPF